MATQRIGEDRDMVFDKLSLIRKHYNQLLLRQRVMVLLALISLLYLFWVLLIKMTLDEKEKTLKKENNYLVTLLDESALNKDDISGGENIIDIASLNNRLLTIKTELDDLNADLKQYYGIGNSSDEVIAIIKDLVATSDNLSLEKVEMLPVEKIAVKINLEETDGINLSKPEGKIIEERVVESGSSQFNTQDNAKDILLYKHRIRIEIVGGYIDVAHYLSRIEKLSWGLFAQDIHYLVERHPLARTRLILYSLSLRGHAADV